MRECKCDMRTRLVGDGCDVCNPEQALEYATETIADLTKECDELAAQVEVMRDALDELEGYARNFSVSGVYLSEEIEGRRLLDKAVDAATITASAALREIQARTLEEAANLLPTTGMEEQALIQLGVTGFLRCRAAAKRKGE